MPTEKNIKSPEYLLELFKEYKEHCKKSPKYENIYSNKTGEIVSIPREIPLTWVGFDVFLYKKKVIASIKDYKTNKDDIYAAYSDIITYIAREVEEDQLNGATAGIFNPNIIARKLGLVDKKEHDHKGEVKTTTINIVKPNGD